MIYKILTLIYITFYGVSAYASRGWYVSIGGLSTKQSHDVSNYSYSRDVIVLNTANVMAIPSIPSGNTYWFAQDSANNNSINSFSGFSELRNTVDGKYVLNTVVFKVNNEIMNGTSAPSFIVTSGAPNAMVISNTSPTNTTGGDMANGILTYTYNGVDQVIGTIDRLATSPSFYQVTLNPINITPEMYKGNILLAMDSKASIRTQQQMQDFLSLFNGQSSRTAEVSIGYKFRPLRSPFFIAPQADFTYFKNNGTNKSAYINTTTHAISSVQKIPSDTFVTYGNFDLSYTASLIFKIGFEQRFWLGGLKVPFSMYGIFGGSSSFRSLNGIRDNAFGFKYGFGGEIFLSEKLAFFGEFYQIQYIAQNYIFDSMSNDTGNALNAALGSNISASITNNGGSNEKSIAINYIGNANQLFSAQTKTTEQFKLQSKISAIKIGLTYYFK